MDKPKILVLLGSSREGRHGVKIFEWVKKELSQKIEAVFEFIDAKDLQLGYYNEPLYPSMIEPGKYNDPNAEAWRQKVEAADGFIILVPEYNRGYPAILKSALDIVYNEWNRKPVAFIGYSSGPIGGARVVEQLKQVMVELQMAVVRAAVYVSNVEESFTENGPVDAKAWNDRLNTLLEHLMWWTIALKQARTK